LGSSVLISESWYKPANAWLRHAKLANALLDAMVADAEGDGPECV
jgi:hypothetical protein